ncbi:FAD-binding oxidoreductase, partial [Bacteroides thetaiotaomicron]
YSVKENVELARKSWHVFNTFPEYLGDDEASCGLVKCGYMIVASEGDKLEPLRASLDQQKEQGVPLEFLNRQQAAELLP